METTETITLENALPVSQLIDLMILGNNDVYGVGSMGTPSSSSTDMSSSRVQNDTTAGDLLKNVPNLYRLATGGFTNTTALSSFYQPPHIAFLRG